MSVAGNILVAVCPNLAGSRRQPSVVFRCDLKRSSPEFQHRSASAHGMCCWRGPTTSTSSSRSFGMVVRLWPRSAVGASLRTQRFQRLIFVLQDPLTCNTHSTGSSPILSICVRIVEGRPRSATVLVFSNLWKLPTRLYQV